MTWHWERFGQGKRELKGLIGKRQKEERKKKKKKRRNKNSPRLWRVKMHLELILMNMDHTVVVIERNLIGIL